MAKENMTAVLIHGAGTGAWVWEEVQSKLGITSLAIDLPLHESLSTPEYCAGIIQEQLAALDGTRFVLVLHSWAGVLAGVLANALGDSLLHTVYLSAVIPADNTSFVDALPIPGRWILKLLYSRNPDGLRPSESMIRKEYCNDLSEATAQMVVDRFTVQRPAPYLSSVPGPRPGAPSTYILLAQDRSISPSLQKKYARRVGNANVISLDAGHLAMLSKSAEIAAAIERVGHKG